MNNFGYLKNLWVTLVHKNNLLFQIKFMFKIKLIHSKFNMFKIIFSYFFVGLGKMSEPQIKGLI